MIQVAGGSVLPLRQDDLKLTGHSFEARIYAEDPENDFMPGAGPLTYLSPPPTDDTIRVETGVRQGNFALLFSAETQSRILDLLFRTLTFS